jgi:hypothetical protein
MYWIVIGRKQRRIGRIQGLIPTKLLNCSVDLYSIPITYEETSVQKTGLIHTRTESREKMADALKMKARWAGGIANSLRARDRNVAHSCDGSKPMGFTDTYLRYDINWRRLEIFFQQKQIELLSLMWQLWANGWMRFTDSCSRYNILSFAEL